MLLKLLLTEMGYLVTCVSTGREAVRILRTMHVDLVITDVLMPDGDGIEVITELKRAQPSVRVIAMSGGGKHLGATECLRLASGLGAHGILTKPFTHEQLSEVVSQQFCPGTSVHQA